MGTDRFRPKLEQVEDRLTPAVSQADAAFALDFVQAGREELGTIWQHAGDPKTAFVLSYHKTYLTQVSFVSQAMADTLATFAAQVRAGSAGDPAAAAAFAPYLANIDAGQQMAVGNIALAQSAAVGFGVPVSTFSPPPPPVSPPPAAPPTTGPSTTPLDPTNAEGISRTIPDLNSSEWKTQADGLRIWDVVTGSGTPYKVGDSITVHYVGWLTNGTEFDSSLSRNAPSTFTLADGSLIKGWVEGIPGLQPGGLRRLDIPAELAYGSQARTGIPATSRLIFEIKGLTPGTT